MQLWKNWKTYLWRWLLLGAIGGLTQWVDGEQDYWTVKGYQVLNGLLFGLIAFAIFTPLQNKVNPDRKRWLSWVTVLGTWMGLKFAVVYLSA